jgi:hypothetical protein
VLALNKRRAVQAGRLGDDFDELVVLSLEIDNLMDMGLCSIGLAWMVKALKLLWSHSTYTVRH